jgi:hypothetical protein
MELYRHTQIGHVIRLSIGAGILMAAIAFGITLNAGQTTPAIITGATLGLLALSLVLFHSMTVSVRDDAIALSFGPGIIRKTIATADVASCRTVRNPWYYGWGIHLTPAGWLFNVSGFDAVEVTLANGRRYRIGTDAPQELEAAIRKLKS